MTTVDELPYDSHDIDGSKPQKSDSASGPTGFGRCKGVKLQRKDSVHNYTERANALSQKDGQMDELSGVKLLSMNGKTLSLHGDHSVSTIPELSPEADTEAPDLAKEHFFFAPLEPPTPPRDAPWQPDWEGPEEFWRALEAQWEKREIADEDAFAARAYMYDWGVAMEYPVRHTPQVAREEYREHLEQEEEVERAFWEGLGNPTPKEGWNDN